MIVVICLVVIAFFAEQIASGLDTLLAVLVKWLKIALDAKKAQ